MAQTITCDVHGNEHPADVLVSQLTGPGETFAACADGYVEMCRAIVATADQPEVDATDADALARLGVDPEPNPTEPPESSGEGDPPAEPPTNDVDEPEPTEPDPSATPARKGRPDPASGPTDAVVESVE